MRLLFVCTGNICRSPTAESVFRHLAGAAGVVDRIHVESAGTHGYHVGEPPDERTRTAAGLRGYFMDGQVARKVAPEDFETFDLILAMDRGHKAHLDRMAPHAVGKIRLFLEFAPGAGRQDVPDPYYGGAEGFELVLDLIEAGSRGLLARLQEQATRGEPA